MMRQEFNVVASSFRYKETGTKNLNNCQVIRQPNADQLIQFLGNYLNYLFLFPHVRMSCQQQ